MADELAALDKLVDESALTSYCEALLRILVGGAMASAVDTYTSNSPEAAGERQAQAEAAGVDAQALGSAAADQNIDCLAGCPPEEEEWEEELQSWSSGDSEDTGASEVGDADDMETEESKDEAKPASSQEERETGVQTENEQEDQEQSSFEADGEDDGLDWSAECVPATPPRRHWEDKGTPEKEREEVWPEWRLLGDDSSDDPFECHEYCNESEC